jgi:hypothetical protein
MKFMDWINKQVCRYFGHRWSEWSYFTEYNGDFPVPMKKCQCNRCGAVIFDLDMPKPVNCRCWIEPMRPETPE